ncbi:MAG: porin [Planctomycetota bacterium]|nr:porin [Planctomycetota bacterium]
MSRTALAGDNSDWERRFREQEARIEALNNEVRRLHAVEAAKRSTVESEVEGYLVATETGADTPLGSTGRSAGGDPAFGGRVRLGGYFSVEFRDDGDGATMEFDQHRLVPKIQADIADGILFETEIEIEGGGADVGFLDDNEILVEYAILRFELVEDRLDFTAGLILVPWGRFNLYHDDPVNDLTDRPLVSRRIGAVAFDQPGVGLSGTVEAGRGWFIDIDVALVQGFDDEFSTNGGVRDSRQSFRSDNNDNKQLFGRIVITPATGRVQVLEFGVSFTRGKHDDAGQLENYGYGLDLFVKHGPVEFTAEYMMLRIEQPVGAAPGAPRRMDGWYVQIAYHFFPAGWRGRHKLFTDESTFTFVVRVEGIDLNHSTSGSTFRDDLFQVTIGINFRPVEKNVIKISYTFVDSDEAGFDSGSADKFLISWATYF